MDTDWLLGWPIVTLAGGVPLVMALWGAIISQRAGIFNVALDSMMTWGAFWFALLYGLMLEWRLGPAWSAAVGSTIVLGGVLGFAYAWLIEKVGLEMIVTGVALGITITGLVDGLGKLLALGGVSAVVSVGDFRQWMYLAVLGAAMGGTALLAWFLWQTPWGVRVRSVGEDDGAAARQCGLDVNRYRIWVSVFTAAACALGGVILVMLSGYYKTGMSGGRGFVALASALMCQGRVLPAFGTAFLFTALRSAYVEERLVELIAASRELVDATSYLLLLTGLIVSFILTRKRQERTG